MIFLYKLTIYSRHDDGHRESFDIGIFRTKEEADAVAKRYLSSVKGFCEYECELRITDHALNGMSILPIHVYSWIGWNLDRHHNDIDILESEFFPTEGQAFEDMHHAQALFPREQWACLRWKIDQCEWEEGFERYTYDA